MHAGIEVCVNGTGSLSTEREFLFYRECKFCYDADIVSLCTHNWCQCTPLRLYSSCGLIISMCFQISVAALSSKQLPSVRLS
jgi:hypothetical protein